VFRAEVSKPNRIGAAARDLKRAGGNYRRELAAELRKSTKVVYKAVESAVETGDMRGRPVRGAKKRFPQGIGAGNHVRKPVLRGLSWNVSTSAGNPRADVIFSPNKVAIRVRALVAYIAGQKTRLRHPIMGKTRDGSWRGGVGQNMPNAWTRARQLLDGAQKAAGRALDRTARIMAGR
jgi:hypothetical protein